MKNPVKNLITWSHGHLITSPKSAFTLAEVLITLAIIGVVAAMTIPTLVANYQEKSWDTSATIFDRKLTEALKVMNTQSSLAGLGTTENFVEELSKHLKITKTCDNRHLTDCFSEEIIWGGEVVNINDLSQAKHFGQNEWDTNLVGVQIANGTTALIAYNPTESCKQDPYSNQVTGGNCLAIVYDTSGYKSPNTGAKDIRANGNVRYLDGADCLARIAGICISSIVPAGSTYMTYEECAGENATAPFDNTPAGEYARSFGIENCSWEQDYWAGAVRACGHRNKMIDFAGLAAIANEVYGTSGIGNEDYFSCSNGNCRKDSVLSSIGIPVTSGSSVAIWAKSFQDDAQGAHARWFGTNSTGTDYGNGDGYRASDYTYAICVAE
ncbi:MAG: type II secretion system protein [Cyanobacteria bacterium SIG32]|nr:type II secretion system protein [Cyanobacteria bacterium SIG32]